MLTPRRPTHRYPITVAIVIVVSSVVAGAAMASHREEAEGESNHAPAVCPTDHVERGDVDRRRPPQSTVHPLLAEQVGVGLGPATVLRLDMFGRVAAVATNTGCPPRQGDDVYVKVNGSTTRVNDVDISRVQWDGDFSHPGKYYRQRHARLCLLSRGCL